MGQTVAIRDSVVIGDTLLISTDRSFTGQDGQAIGRGEPGDAVPGVLADGLFESDPGIDHLYVLQNTVSIRRPEGWDDAAQARILEVISGFLRFYEDA